MKFTPAVPLALLAASFLPFAGAPQAHADGVAHAPNFRLVTSAGTSVELVRERDAKALVLVLWSDTATGAAGIAETLEPLIADFKPLGARFFLLDPVAVRQLAGVLPPEEKKQGGLLDAAAQLGKSFGISLAGAPKGDPNSRGDALGIPRLLDDAQLVTTALGLSRAGEVLVLAPETRAVRARGVLQAGDGGWLRDALQAAVAGEAAGGGGPVGVGEEIGLAAWPESVDYARDAAPIIEAKCVTCHAPGEVGPFAFRSHRDVQKWADMMEEVILTDRMPPWHADPATGPFHNSRALTAAEKRTLVAWARAGAARGEGVDPLEREYAERTSPWRLGTPDVILGAEKAFEIPAEGILEYQLIRVPTGFTEDKWVRGIEMAPGNPKVVHHALVFVEYPKGMKLREPQVGGGTSGFFAGFVPGTEPRFFPAHTGKFVPAGATLIFQIHYVTTGKPETDLTRLGLYLHQTPPAERMETEAAFDTLFAIPPGARDFTVVADDRLWGPVTLWGLSPHMHVRGSRFKYTATYPDGSSEVLLNVPNYSFDWQSMYQFSEPRKLPRGTKITCEGAFDNSPMNPFNPDPKDLVRFGDQTFQEMFIGYYEYSAPVEQWERMFQRREERFAEMSAERQAAGGVEQAGPPLTEEQLIDTHWKEDKFAWVFRANNEMLVNGLIKGTWKIEDNRVIIDVVGEHFELDIIGQGLYFNGSYPVERVK